MFIFDNVKENSISKIWKENEKLKKYNDILGMNIHSFTFILLNFHFKIN